MEEGEWSFLNPNEATREAVHDLVGDEEYIVVLLPDGSKLVRVMFKSVSFSSLSINFVCQENAFACVIW